MGIQQASKDLGVNGYMIGPIDADPPTRSIGVNNIQKYNKETIDELVAQGP